MTRQVSTFDDARAASWAAVIAGAVTVIAFIFVLSLFSTTMGLSAVDAHSSNPFSGVGATFGISSAFSLLIALGVGGFIAGRLAGRSGLIHGMLTWAVSFIITVAFGIMAVSGAARIASSAAGAVASGVGPVATATGSAIGSVVEVIDENLIGDIDFSQTRKDLRSALRQTNIDALKPERLENALDGARSDLSNAARQLVFNPNALPRIAEQLSARLRGHVEEIADDIDRDEAVAGLVNSGVPRMQAEEAVDNAIVVFNNARDAVVGSIERADALLESGLGYLEDLEREVKRQADEAARAASSAAFWGFIAAVLGAVIASFAGLIGAATRDKYNSL